MNSRMCRRRGSAMALKGSEIVEARAMHRSIYSDMGICQVTIGRCGRQPHRTVCELGVRYRNNDGKNDGPELRCPTEHHSSSRDISEAAGLPIGAPGGTSGVANGFAGEPCRVMNRLISAAMS